MLFAQQHDTIAAIATAQGIGAIGVIRLSGREAVNIANTIFKGKDLTQQATHTIHFGHIIAPPATVQAGAVPEIIDEVVVSLFLGTKSYTGENTIEISGHGSPYILQQILQACIQAGARPAQPGEFTQRAFLNGKLDLTQAEAVADLISANSKAAQQTALNQLRGGFSHDLKELREQLIHFAALIELELDFAEEDVEFANRDQFRQLVKQLQDKTNQLIASFQLGNAVKNGLSVAIIGQPNAGKSTLLNALLNEDRAIVSDIAGTTRDSIEEQINIQGILFRLIDTAGIRESKGDQIEDIGIERSKANARKADIIIHLQSLTESSRDEDTAWLDVYRNKIIDVYNKVDEWEAQIPQPNGCSVPQDSKALYISAKAGIGIEALRERLLQQVNNGNINTENTVVTNTRHQAALLKIAESLSDIQSGMHNHISGELLALDIRRCLHYLGEITGQVEVDRDILGTIFGKFCIGK